MLKTFQIDEEVKRLIPIKGRGEQTSEVEVMAAFANLGVGELPDVSVFLGTFDGNAGWERHVRGEELVHVISGTTEFDIIVDDDLETLHLSAGSFLIVPAGCWHRFRSEEGVTVLTATPKTDEPHYFVDDPRRM